MNYKVIVIGGGHAGCEAALASARNGVKTLLISINMDSIALMPFGGTIGGTGKDKIIREIDALGGEISKNTDKNYINIINVPGKGGRALKTIQAVVDRRRYFLSMKKVLEDQDNLDLRQGLAVRIEKKLKKFYLYTSDEIIYSCRAIVLCTGTFLRGKIFWGRRIIEAGRQGEICSRRLSISIVKMGVKLDRIRSYAAPSVDRKTIDINRLLKQPSERCPELFSHERKINGREQLNSYITFTDRKCTKYILRSINKAGDSKRYIYSEKGGDINSIEGRILENKKNENFKVCIQPLGRDTNEMYLQGLETALPEEVQIGMVRRINGLENTEITRPGYGVEYNYLKPFQIKNNLEGKNIEGIFFAGNINGTGSYEEAAAQGIIAGINAARKSRGLGSMVIGKKYEYIGMIIEGLVDRENNGLKSKDIVSRET